MSVAGIESGQKRIFRGWDFFVLWAGAAISLSEIWAGGLLVPLGLAGGVLAILLGHLIGNTPMALSGVIGSRHGVPAIVSTRAALGQRGAWLPGLLNVIQLVGWTGVMLWIGGQAAARLLKIDARLWIALLGIITTLWALAGSERWKWLQRISVAALLLLSCVMTWSALSTYGIGRAAASQPTRELGFMSGLDLVIAMPISWMPLVSDYSRLATRTRSAFWGTWWGYLLVGSWMYLVGLYAALATGSTEPDAMVLDLLSGHGLLAAALLIVLFSTFTTTFLDIYSTAISAQSLFPQLNERLLVLVGGTLGTLAALVFTPSAYEGFLLFIGSAFCPLFGVVLTDYFVVHRGHYNAADLFRRGRYWYRGGVNPAAVAAWAAGFAMYRLAVWKAWPAGGSLPSLIGAGLLYGLLMQRRRTPGGQETVPHQH